MDQVDPDPHRDWEGHIRNMSRDGTWATHLEVIASAEMFGLMVYTWARSACGIRVIDIVRPMIPTVHGVQMLNMIMFGWNHYNSLHLTEEFQVEKDEEVRKYNDELQRIQVQGEGNASLGDVDIGDIEECETGFSSDRLVKITVTRSDMRDMVQVSQSVVMLWEQLKESEIGFALYYDNRDDAPESVLGDGFCGYRSFDAVSHGLQAHTHRLEVAAVIQMRGHSRQGSPADTRCGEVITVLQQGHQTLPENLWLNRRFFSDIICPVHLFLWMVAYEENFNVLVGSGEAGRYMRTREGRILITRNEIKMYLREQGRDIVFANFHFYLGCSIVTIQRIDEALFQLACRLWCRKLEQVGELGELRQGVCRYRNELYHVYYPP
jgi:hypothetical protein